MGMFGIDVSRFQGNFNFAQAKLEGVEYVIMRAGGADDPHEGMYSDAKFYDYYNEVSNLRLPRGAFYLFNAYTLEDARKEAKHFSNLIQGKDFEMPLFADVEGKILGAVGLSDLVLEFLTELKRLRPNDKVGLYASRDHINGLFDVKKYAENNIVMWVAYYSANKPILKDGVNVDIWQYGGNINEIRDNRIAGTIVDQDYCYMDIPEFIVKEYEPQPQPTVSTKYQIGDVVEFTKIHTTSADNIDLKPLYSTGTITNILVNAKNQYLINNGMGWVRESDIVTENVEIEDTNTPLKKGDKIRVKEGAKDQNYFVTFADAVYQNEYTVIACDSKYVVFGTNKAVTGKILLEDAIYDNKPLPFDNTLKVGDRVRLIDNVNIAGVRLLPRDYFVIEEVSDDGTCVIDYDDVTIARVYQDNVERI